MFQLKDLPLQRALQFLFMREEIHRLALRLG
jgi:hypothetical protein